MPCYAPNNGHYKNGKFIFGFPFNKKNVEEMVQIPCGQCMGCRVQRSLDWGIRCANEIQMHDTACFITLTYAPEFLPDDGNLVKKDLQKFIKRLRKAVGTIRYYACGEYGDKTDRPHYHALIFGYDFPDKEYFFESTGYGGVKNKVYRSAMLEKLWPQGISSIGEANFTTACYISRYITKKRLGKGALDYYVDTETGEILKEPEFTTMSLKPGIGASWYETFSSDVFPSDELIHQGNRFKVPRYYMTLLERSNPELYLEVKKARKERMQEFREEAFNKGLDYWKQLVAGETIAQAKQLLKMGSL
ncbi:replication initiator protein [Microviridae sp.]|nr:replication initiator protein [Microviridae sp.]